MSPVGFRTRLFLILTLFATLPSIVLTLVWAGTFARALPLVSGSSAWERAAATGGQSDRGGAGRAALRGAIARRFAPTKSSSRSRSRRLDGSAIIAQRAVPVIAVMAVVALGVLIVVSSRVAGHLSRQLSRPIDELVGWTDRLGRGEELPEGHAVERAHRSSRCCGRECGRWRASLRDARAREIEAERLRAFRESARQVAHELKNPLTPIRFAVARLRREAPASLARRGRSARRRVAAARGNGPQLRAVRPAARRAARGCRRRRARRDTRRACRFRLTWKPMFASRATCRWCAVITTRSRARCRTCSSTRSMRVASGRTDRPDRTPRIGVTVARERRNGDDGIVIAVRDSGCGIPADRLARIWEPYVTSKPGGTGLGLAIARQTVLAHNGTVHASSTVGDGTEIRFTLPAAGIDATEAVSANSR